MQRLALAVGSLGIAAVVFLVIAASVAVSAVALYAGAGPAGLLAFLIAPAAVLIGHRLT